MFIKEPDPRICDTACLSRSQNTFGSRRLSDEKFCIGDLKVMFQLGYRVRWVYAGEYSSRGDYAKDKNSKVDLSVRISRGKLS